jgi:hypothetical protein
MSYQAMLQLVNLETWQEMLVFQVGMADGQSEVCLVDGEDQRLETMWASSPEEGRRLMAELAQVAAARLLTGLPADPQSGL